MSDRQNLAEHGTGLCLWAIGAASLTTPLVGMAVVVAACFDIYHNSGNARKRDAMAKAVTALEDSGIPERGITAALAFIKGMKVEIRVDPALLKQVQSRNAMPDAIYDGVFATLHVPPDDRVEEALRLVVAEVWEVLRLADDTHKLMAQESLLTIETEQRAGFNRTDENVAQLVAGQAQLVAGQDRSTAINEQILKMLQEKPDYPRLRDAGISEDAILGLFSTAGIEAANLRDALRQFELLVESAINAANPGEHESNLGDFMDGVLAQVAALSRLGEHAQAVAFVVDSLRQNPDASLPQRLRLLDAAVEQEKLAGNADSVARRLIERSDLEAGGQTKFNDLWAMQDKWRARGNERGLALDQLIAIALAHQIVPRAQTTDERGRAQNDLGVALQERGARDGDTARLEQSLILFDAALAYRPRDRVPLDWAATVENKAIARARLAEKGDAVNRLLQAKEGFEQALEIWEKHKKKEKEARTLLNLGPVLRNLGERTGDIGLLELAVDALETAASFFSDKHMPQELAMTQMNLGTALRALGECETGTTLLEQAEAACKGAVMFYTEETARMPWAQIQSNLGIIQIVFFKKTANSAYLDQAEVYTRAARDMFAQLGSEFYVTKADEQLSSIASLRP